MEPRIIPKEQAELLYQQADQPRGMPQRLPARVPGAKITPRPLINNPSNLLWMSREAVVCIVNGLIAAGEMAPGETADAVHTADDGGYDLTVDDMFQASDGEYHIKNTPEEPLVFRVSFENDEGPMVNGREIDAPEDEPILPTDPPSVKAFKKMRNKKLAVFLGIIKACSSKIGTIVDVPVVAKDMSAKLKQRVRGDVVRKIGYQKGLPADVSNKVAEFVGGRRKTKKSKKSARKTRKTRR